MQPRSSTAATPLGLTLAEGPCSVKKITWNLAMNIAFTCDSMRGRPTGTGRSGRSRPSQSRAPPTTSGCRGTGPTRCPGGHGLREGQAVKKVNHFLIEVLRTGKVADRVVGISRIGGPTRRIPRWMGPVLWLVFGSLFHGALPWGLSRMGTRRGWTVDSPGAANMAGLILVAAGAVLLAWALALHYRSAPEGWPLRMRPFYLLTRGAYRYTRNPKYLGALAM